MLSSFRDSWPSILHRIGELAAVADVSGDRLRDVKINPEKLCYSLCRATIISEKSLIMNDLLNRIFLNFRTSADGLVLTVIAWLSSNGFDVSTARKDQILGWVALAFAALWKFISKDPVPQPEGK